MTSNNDVMILHDNNTFPEDPPVPDEQDIELFKQQVGEWLKLDDQIKKLAIAIRERKTHQRALATKIQEFMIKYNYDNLNTQHGIIKSTIRQVKEPLKVTTIKQKIEEMVSKNTPVNEIMVKVFEGERKLLEKKTLRRVIPKVSLKLEI